MPTVNSHLGFVVLLYRFDEQLGNIWNSGCNSVPVSNVRYFHGCLQELLSCAFDTPYKGLSLAPFLVAIILQSVDDRIIFVACNEILRDSQVARFEGDEKFVGQCVSSACQISEQTST